jgi:hypothetical protein
VTSHDEITFQAPEPRGRTPLNAKADEAFAQALRDRPGEWAVYSEHQRVERARNDRLRILRGRNGFKGGHFEVATRRVSSEPICYRVYVRHLAE